MITSETTTTTTATELNISSSNVTGKCDLKCAFNFNYQPTSLVAENLGTQIILRVDEQNTPPVTYNTEQYKAVFISIFSPSIHLFNNTQTQGEIQILHEPISGGNNLYVCIPLYQSGNSNTATDLITEIITNVAASAPSRGEQTTINLNNFTLQNIVPEKPFYSFTETGFSSSNYIIYGLINGIPLSQSTFTTLSSIITASTPATYPQTDIFYNSLGPNLSGSTAGEGIYISCNPTGASENTSNVEVKNATTNNLASILNNPMFMQVFVGCILFIFIFFVISLLFNFIAGKPMQMPSYLTPKKSSSTT